MHRCMLYKTDPSYSCASAWSSSGLLLHILLILISLLCLTLRLSWRPVFSIRQQISGAAAAVHSRQHLSRSNQRFSPIWYQGWVPPKITTPVVVSKAYSCCSTLTLLYFPQWAQATQDFSTRTQTRNLIGGPHISMVRTCFYLFIIYSSITKIKEFIFTISLSADQMVSRWNSPRMDTRILQCTRA